MLYGRVPISYRDAGVDMDEGDRLVELIKPIAKTTHRPEVMAGVGGFASLFSLPKDRYKDPVLVSGTDGVGTKLKLAFDLNRHDTIGIDLVAMSVNDVAVTGAEPLFFLDYFATSKLSAEQAAQVVLGIAEGCRQAGCALVGGETAELPGFYQPGEYDLAGFCVGVVERSRILDGRRVAVGDAIVGIASTGLHSNGYSLARAILARAKLDLGGRPKELSMSLGEALLTPTRIYNRDLSALAEAVDLRAAAHITGAGIPGNLPRVLPDDSAAVLDSRTWQRPAIFDYLAGQGDVSTDEMYRTFNMGLGMCTVIPPSDVDTALRTLAKRGVQAWRVGEIVKGKGEATAEIR
jgi:phosphoribosylformylglycinamidine cyclo-ligase